MSLKHFSTRQMPGALWRVQPGAHFGFRPKFRFRLGVPSRLLVAGLLSELLYLVLALRLPWWRYGDRLRRWAKLLGEGWGPFFACLAGIGLLMAAFGFGWRAVRQGGRGGRSEYRRLTWSFAFLFAVTLFWLLPITADLFIYLSRAHLLTDLGQNPLRVALLDVPDDRLVRAYATAYAAQPSMYGPAWLLFSAPATLGPHDVVGGVGYLKGLAAFAYLGSAWLLTRILRQVRPAAEGEGLIFFAWNPLVLLMAVGDGHNDALMMALVLVSLWLLLRERWGLALGVLVLSAWIKVVSLIFCPLFVLYVWQRLRAQHHSCVALAVGGGLAAAAGVSVLVLAPFWEPGLIYSFVERLFHPANWSASASGVSTALLAVGLLLFGAAYLLLLWRLARGDGSFRQVANASFGVALLAFVLGAARSQPWHLLWAVSLAALSDRRWAMPIVAALSALMLFAQVWIEWGLPGC